MIVFENEQIHKVAVYTRVSTEEQSERGFSLDAQLSKLKGYCENYDLEIIDIYTDPGYSGRNTRRPEYQRMLQEIDRWEGILVLKMDRIHRNQKNFMGMMDQLRKTDKEFISMQEKFDTSTAMGRFVMNILQGIAQLESEQIGERVAIAMVQKAKDKTKKFQEHKVPFGYIWDKKKEKFVEIPEKLEIVKEAFLLYSNGKGIDPIKETSEGFVNTITGKKIKGKEVERLRTRYRTEGHSFRSVSKILGKPDTTIRYFLNNIFYAGYERYCHYFRKISGITPIVNSELWNKTQKKMRDHARSKDYDPLLIPDDFPEIFVLDKKRVRMLPTINRAKHNYNF